MTRKNPSWEIKSTGKSLDIVDFIQRTDGATISELLEEFDLSKSTLYKHLKTLKTRGYLTKEGEEYHVGLRFFHRGEYARTRRVGYRLAAQAVQELAKETGEETDFHVENDGRMIVIYESYHPDNPYGEDLNHPVEIREFAGTYYNMHSIAAGKATLATYSREQVEDIIDQWDLPARTDHTITSRERLFEELDQIREEGYARNDEEYADGLRAIATTVTAADGTLLGTLSVSGPVYRMAGEKYETQLPNLLTETASDLEASIRKKRREAFATGESNEE